MTTALRLGVTPWRDPGDGRAAVLEDQAVRAEELGFHSLWLPESHFAGSGAIPAPFLLLAAIAARTRRLRIGTTSYLLPMRHPLHAAEEVAVLDRLSEGRLELGVGRGFRKSLFAAFEVPVGEKRARFEAALDAMRRAWAGEPVATAGDGDEVRAGEPVYLAPRPWQRPHPPIYVAAFGPRAIEQAGRLGLPYLASPLEPIAALEANYARHREAGGGAAPAGAVPVMRTVFISTRDDALARARASLVRQAERFSRSRPYPVDDREIHRIDRWAVVGTPSEAAERIREYRERLGVTHLIGARLRIAGLEPGLVEESTEHLATLGV